MEEYGKLVLKVGKQIEDTFQEYGVSIELISVEMDINGDNYNFRVKILRGTKVKSIYKYASDVRAAMGVEMIYPHEETGSLYLAVSKRNNTDNGLQKILNNARFTKAKMQIPLAIGRDIMNRIHVEDMVELVHILVVGASGTGKSVALECMILSIVRRCSVYQARLLLFDVGANSLSSFEDVPHLLHPIVKDTDTGIRALEALVKEMDARIAIGKEECKKCPYLICIIDEFDDMVASVEKKISQRYIDAINSIIRRGRKAKVILVLASHTPTVKTTGIAINGIMSRIVFKCANGRESYTAIGESGAELLTGKGTMLLKSKNGSKPIMLRGAFVTDEEVEKMLDKLPDAAENLKMLEIADSETASVCINKNAPKKRKELAGIIIWTLKHATTSVHQLQKEFHRNNEKCKEVMDILEQFGIVSPQFAKQPRTVIPKSVEDLTEEVLKILEYGGFSVEQIKNVFDSRQ